MRIKKRLPDLAIIFFFFILSAIYNYPELSGKRLAQNDVLQSQGASQELRDYREKTGKVGLWTNSMFSGMPAYMVYAERPNSLTLRLGRLLHYTLLPITTNIVFMLLVTSFLALLILGFDRWISVLGAIGIVFASYNFINIDAGHVSKLLAQTYAFPLIASIIITWRGKYLIGGTLTALFAGLELYSNHIQITYYVFLTLLIIGAYELIQALKAGKVKEFMIGTAVLLVAGGIALGTNASLLMPNYEYSKQTIRGPSELKANAKTKGGLDINYAFQWSYGITESFTVLIPNFYGGASGGKLGKKSNMYEVMTRRGYQGRQAEQFLERQPLYWGDMPFTSGPAYYGAIICLLFVFSLFVAKSDFKWWLLGIVIFLLFLSWGRNFSAFNNFFFYNVPLYNKFRAVNMLFSLINIFMVWGIALGLKDALTGEIKGKRLMKPLGYSVGIVGGIVVIFALLGGGLFDFEAARDQTYLEQMEKHIFKNKGVAIDMIDALQKDRAALMQKDALRSLVFILLAAGLLWALFTEKIKREYALAGIALLVLVDLWGVNKRYLNNKSFKKKTNAEAVKKPQPYDLEILQKGKDDPHYRVLNDSKSYMNDATTSFHHKSIGGYHGAKLRRYQELVDAHLTNNIKAAYKLLTNAKTLKPHNPASNENVSVLSMLNMKYMVVGNPGQVFQNTNAMGNAWFVDNYKVVKDSDEELASLKVFDPKKIAFVNPKFAKAVEGLKITPDNKATIKLLSYAPDELKYETNASSKQLAVFSEIYYNKGWEVLIDDKPASFFRVNYVLRGLVVPAGKHTIKCHFTSKTFATGESIALVSSMLLLLGIVGAITLYFKNAETKEEAKEELR